MNSVNNSEDIYMIKTTGKISVLWICRILFFGCFFLAIFLANTIWQNEAAWIGYLHENRFLNLPAEIAEGRENLEYVILTRLPFWVGMVLFGRKLIGLIMAQIYTAWQGFMLGFILAAFMIRYGMMGAIVFFCMCFPQIIFYIIAYMILYHVIFKLYRKKHAAKILGEEQEQKGQTARAYVMLCILLTIVFAIGIFFESYVNYFFLRKIPHFISLI